MIIITVIVVSGLIGGRNVYSKKKGKKVVKTDVEITHYTEVKELASFFNDITHTYAVVIMLKSQSIPLSKALYSENNRLEETLFSGFVSAFIQVKKELTTQIGIKKASSNSNGTVFEDASHVITVFEENELQLAVISKSRLSAYTAHKCSTALEFYERKHHYDIEEFNNDISPFEDFPKFIDVALSLALNKKCIVDGNMMRILEAPEPVVNYLQRMSTYSEMFYPKDLFVKFKKELGLSTINAAYHVTDAFKKKIIIPHSREKKTKERYQ